MQKVIIDTNVIVSSLIQNSYPYVIVDKVFIEGNIILCVSKELMAEYHEVLARPKFGRFPDFFMRAEALLVEIETNAKMYVPTVKIELISDEDDNRLLELADESRADFIITGNTSDFTFSTYKQTKIVTPKEYWEKYKPE